MPASSAKTSMVASESACVTRVSVQLTLIVYWFGRPSSLLGSDSAV